MFEGVSKCKFDLSDDLEQDFNAFQKAQFKNTVIVTELFKEDSIILVLKPFLKLIFGFGCCQGFCRDNMTTLVVTC